MQRYMWPNQMANQLSGFIRHNPNRDLNMYDYRAVSPICREIAIHINTIFIAYMTTIGRKGHPCSTPVLCLLCPLKERSECLPYTDRVSENKNHMTTTIKGHWAVRYC